MAFARFYLCFIVVISCFVSCTTKQNDLDSRYEYSTPKETWDEALGNHRVVFTVKTSSPVVDLDFMWRRPDEEVEKHRFLIVNAETGDTIKNIRRLEVNSERCHIHFGPIEKGGKFYFYYLPFKVQTGSGYYYKDYERHDFKADTLWLGHSKRSSIRQNAVIQEIQSRTPFDSFYPMEVAALNEEVEAYMLANVADFHAFPEKRENPIRMRKKLPLKWITNPSKSIYGDAAPNEYFTFQVGMYSHDRAVDSITCAFSDLRCGVEKIPASAFTCFNMGGVDPYGNDFVKRVDLAVREVKPLWFGLDIPSGQTEGLYTGNLYIMDTMGHKVEIPIAINISGDELADRGDSETWRHSRLRWLNSRLGISDQTTGGYDTVVYSDSIFVCSSKKYSYAENSPLPYSITCNDDELLAMPIEFNVEVGGKKCNFALSCIKSEKHKSYLNRVYGGGDDKVDLICEVCNDFDGYSKYSYKIRPKVNVKISDVNLVVPLKSESSPYFMGFGLHAMKTPLSYSASWSAPAPKYASYGWRTPFDSFWCGSVNVGLHCELRGSSYSGPLLNLYKPEYPESWNNGGKGGLSIQSSKNVTNIKVYSGSRNMLQGDSLTFEFAILITPVKKLNTVSQFTDRYYHNAAHPQPSDDDIKAGVKVINIHHANQYNPFINYPFKATDSLSSFVKKFHKKDCKVKIYYTLRELSNSCSEIWAFKALDEEILSGGSGGGYPWCREHMVDDYTHQWYHHWDTLMYGVMADAAVLTAERESRLYNYYVEGLNWLVKNVDIDGIYMDDVSFGRTILQRIRRTMDAVKPGCIIDLHSNTGFSKGPAIQYAEFFPYIDKLWFGESFNYNAMTPEEWLVESSGIPFGLMGDMLQAGGNPWLGMQYGMTVRHPWVTEGIVSNPKPMWKVWDEFKVADSKMIGFWDKSPVTASNPNVKVTVYVRNSEALISVGNYSDKPQKTKLKIDFEALGIVRDPKLALWMPKIEDFQEKAIYSPDDDFELQPRKGFVFYLQ